MKGADMENISDLIKEAKPLYFAKKKRNNRIKTGFCCLGCLFLMISVWPQKEMIDASYYWDFNDIAEEGTYVENYGFPVDDYGLLLVG